MTDRQPLVSRLRLALPYLLSAGLGALLVICFQSFRLPRTPEARAVVPDLATADARSFAWSRLPTPEFAIPPYARFLKGVSIVLDPGHVGQRDRGGSWKRGPTGLREAEANLRVAFALREFLQAAGARVTLTREVDRSLDLPDDEDLAQRADVANSIEADLLLSIHHNAADSPTANYTTLWYHRGPEHSPASLDAARYLLTGLNDALRLDQHVECALQNDFLMYPQSGFRVLREARVPAVLSESSFHTHPDEEDRLRDPIYNRREAYGMFLGLARWAQAGLPRVSVVEPTSGMPARGKPIVISLDDGLTRRGGMGREFRKVVDDTIRVEIDGKPLRFEADLRRGVLQVTPPADALNGPFTLQVQFENIFGQNVLHPALEFPVRPKSDFTPLPALSRP